MGRKEGIVGVSVPDYRIEEVSHPAISDIVNYVREVDLAQEFHSFGNPILPYDPHSRDPDRYFWVELLPLEELHSRTDVLSIRAPLDQEPPT